MKNQDVLFVCSSKFLESKAVTQLRMCLYDLRKMAFTQNVNVRVGFFKIEKNTDVIGNLVFSDLDKFTFSKNNEKSFYSSTTLNQIKNYLENLPEGDEIYAPKIVYLQEKDVSLPLQKELILTAALKNCHAQIKNVAPVQAGDLAQNVQSFLLKRAKSQKKLFSNKIVGIVLGACAAIALISALPFVIQKITFKKIVYEKVYTGDGDRLILRIEGSRDADEIVRMNEGECVQVIEEGEEWNYVNYHGLSGYCHKEYLVPATEEEYVITKADSKYSYGKACVKFLDPAQVDGYVWISEAALSGLIRAQWFLSSLYEKGSDDVRKDSGKHKEWLLAVYNNELCLEDSEIEENYAIAKQKENAGDKELAKKYKDKAKDRERNVKEIRQLSAKKLSELYFDIDIQQSSDYYKVAVKRGLKANKAYMGKLAENNRLKFSDRKYWAEKAFDAGNSESLFNLAEEYLNGNIDSYEAFKMFEKIVNTYYYDAYYYNSCYYMGYCYENGYGVQQSIKNAMKYYGLAYYNNSFAKQAYNRIYEYYGDYYIWY